MFIHCVIHWWVVCNKYLHVSHVIELVVSMVNFIRSCGLGFLSKIEANIMTCPIPQLQSDDFTEIPFYCTCLSSGLRLKVF